MDQSVGRRPLITQTRLRSQASPCLIFLDEVELGRISVRVLRFSLAVIVPLNSLTFHSYTTDARYKISSSE